MKTQEVQFGGNNYPCFFVFFNEFFFFLIS